MKPHRVLIDGFFMGKPSGFGRFIHELCRSLGRSSAIDLKFIVAVPQSAEERLLAPYPNIEYVRVSDTNFALWEQVRIPALARGRQCSLVHYPYNTKSFIGSGSKSVTTVHDLTFLNTQTQRSVLGSIHNFYVCTLFNFSTKTSNTILAVSETTRAALSERGVSAKLVYNSVDGFLSTPLPDVLPKPERPYLLHRGSYASGHRNTERIIQAFLQRKELTAGHVLKVLGTPDGAARWGIPDNAPVEFLHPVSDEALAALYKQSSCVVAASLLEGFCLPIVEGFGFGAPVIASDINPMKEISGDAAVLVSPYAVDEIADAMVKIVSDEDLSTELVERGRRRLELFSSARMAQALLETYRGLLEGA